MRMEITIDAKEDAIDTLASILAVHKIFGHQMDKGAQDARKEIETFINTCINSARYDEQPRNRTIVLRVYSEQCGLKAINPVEGKPIIDEKPEVVSNMIIMQYYGEKFYVILDFIPMPKVAVREPAVHPFTDFK